MDTLKELQEDRNFKIEDAKPEDVEAMRTIVKDAWTKIYVNADHGITAEDLAAIDWYKDLDRRRKDITERGDTIHVWVIRGEKQDVVGFCKVTKTSDMGEVDGMYVNEELKGKGWANKLMQKAFDWFGPNIDIKLKVASYNSRAIGFYKKVGFIETGKSVTYEGTQLPSGKEIPRIEMVKYH